MTFGNPFSKPVVHLPTPPSVPKKADFSGGYGGGQTQDPYNYSTGLTDLKKSVANGDPLTMGGIVGAMPDYQSIMTQGPNGPVLAAPYKVNPYTSAAYKKMSDMALGNGPTDFYKANLAAINTQTGNSVNALDNSVHDAYATGVSNLAQTGGVDAGARERLNRGMGLNNAMGTADIYTGAGNSIANAGLADAQYKQGLLGQVAGTDIGAQQFNVGNAVGDAYKGNLYNLEGWGKVGDIYGSDQIAQAMAAQANKPDPGLLGQGGLLGTGVDPSKFNPSKPWQSLSTSSNPYINTVTDFGTNPLGVVGAGYNAGKSLLQY